MTLIEMLAILAVFGDVTYTVTEGNVIDIVVNDVYGYDNTKRDIKRSELVTKMYELILKHSTDKTIEFTSNGYPRTYRHIDGYKVSMMYLSNIKRENA